MDTNRKLTPQTEKTLLILIELLIKPECLKRDLFTALLLTTAKENGFHQLKAAGEKPITVVDYILYKSQKEDCVYEAVFVLNKYQDLPIKIIASYLTDVLLINATVSDVSNDIFTTCYKVERYMETSDLGTPCKFNNIDELLIDFKDNILTPTKSAVLNYNKSPSGNLAGLPEDLLHQIMYLLSAKDILSLSETCRRINYIISYDRFWAKLYRRDFDKQAINEDRAWYDMYKEKYVKNRLKMNNKVVSKTSEQFASTSDNIRYGLNPRWEVLL